jgi:ubiquinone/menaquinone biosynthesis C-methylase UbiE
MSQYPADYLRYAWQMLNGFRVNHERTFADLRKRDTSLYLDARQPLCVLDLANGRLRPQYMLLKAAGHHVFGTDWVNRPLGSRMDKAYRIARWLYARQLNLPDVVTGDRTLACSDVGALPFPDNSFDLVTSVAAFEHFLDVPTVVTELARVLRSGGLAWVCIHLFTSPSGGHNLSLVDIPLRTMPTNVEPWDHLRQRRLPFHVPLNEWRRDQYLDAFASSLEIVNHYCAMHEGEAFLTPDVERDLSGYSRDELTLRDYVIVARKPASGTELADVRRRL